MVFILKVAKQYNHFQEIKWRSNYCSYRQNEYDADTVLFAVGVEPATEWLKDKIDLGKKGIININHQQQTSAKDVYAGGDATLVPFAPVSEDRYIALATNSRRQGVVAAKTCWVKK